MVMAPGCNVNAYRVVPGSIPGLESETSFLGPTLENCRHFFFAIGGQNKIPLCLRNKVDSLLLVLS